MDSVLRAAAVYLFLLFVFRVAGRRSLTQITTFDLVLLLIIGEATQQALLGDDFSVTNAAVVITTLVTLHIGISLLQLRWPSFGKVVNDVPLVLWDDGPVDDRMKKARVLPEDIMEEARATQGLERLDQVRYAVLERDGTISIIPKS